MKCLRCGPLIKAIDAYLAKAENDLYEQLTMEGYLKAKESLNTVDEIEEVVTKLLEDNADDLLKELADAIDLADASLLCEELGDVLLQVALHTRMEEEQGAFTFGDVCTGICKKLIYRLRIFFGDAGAQRRTRRCRIGRRSSAGKSTAKARGMTWTACPRPCRR